MSGMDVITSTRSVVTAECLLGERGTTEGEPRASDGQSALQHWFCRSFFSALLCVAIAMQLRCGKDDENGRGRREGGWRASCEHR